MIENSNNIRLKKSTLDTLLLRTYKQTEFLCTHINKHSSDDDDGRFHLFTASVFYPGIVVVIGGSRHQGGCVAEGSCCQRSSFQPPLARLLSLLGEHSPGVSTSSEVLSLRVQKSQEEFTQGELRSCSIRRNPAAEQGAVQGPFPACSAGFGPCSQPGAARVCSAVRTRSVNRAAGQRLPWPVLHPGLRSSWVGCRQMVTVTQDSWTHRQTDRQLALAMPASSITVLRQKPRLLPTDVESLGHSLKSDFLWLNSCPRGWVFLTPGGRSSLSFPKTNHSSLLRPHCLRNEVGADLL